MSWSSQSLAHIIQELQKIWDEIGDSDNEKEKMLLELEQECLDIYQRKVEYTRKHKADLYKALADGESEVARLSAALGVRTSFSRAKGTLNEQLSSVKLALDNLRLTKQQRLQDFSETELQIIRICAEIAGNDQVISNAEPQVNEDDLTTSRLSKRKSHLEELQNEKVLRLQNVHNHISSIHELSVVMSLDFTPIVAEIHSSLVDTGHGQSKSISNDTLAKLTSVVNSLKQEKQQMLQKIQDLGSELFRLWSLLDTPPVDWYKFEHVTDYNKSSVDEVSLPGSLSQDVIKKAESEVARLNILQEKRLVGYKEVSFPFAEEYQKKLITIFVVDDGVQREKGEVDINLCPGYFSFATNIRYLCPSPVDDDDDEEFPLVHISWPWFPLYGVARYYTRTEEGDKRIEPLTMDWESFSGQLDYLVILRLPRSKARISLQVTNNYDEVVQDLAIFKDVVKNSDLLFTAIYFYYCSTYNCEPAEEGKRPEQPWTSATCSYYGENDELISPPYDQLSEVDDEVEVEEDGVVGGGADDDFVQRLVRITIKEAWRE